jgi:hypothetical protein
MINDALFQKQRFLNKNEELSFAKNISAFVIAVKAKKLSWQ